MKVKSFLIKVALVKINFTMMNLYISFVVVVDFHYVMSIFTASQATRYEGVIARIAQGDEI